MSTLEIDTSDDDIPVPDFSELHLDAPATKIPWGIGIAAERQRLIDYFEQTVKQSLRAAFLGPLAREAADAEQMKAVGAAAIHAAQVATDVMCGLRLATAQNPGGMAEQFRSIVEYLVRDYVGRIECLEEELRRTLHLVDELENAVVRLEARHAQPAYR